MNEMPPTPASETARAEVHSLISSELIRGTKVFNAQGDHLGTIMTVMLDKRTGQVAYSVMSFGGFLGIGAKFHPLPWHMLNYDQAKGGYVIELDKERLLAAPSYALTDPIRWEDNEWRTRLDDYYQSPPPANATIGAAAVPVAQATDAISRAST